MASSIWKSLWLVLLTWAISSGCASYPYLWWHQMPPSNAVARIQVGDKISVLVNNQAKASGEFPVRPNGAYAQPQVGEIPVLGLTEKEAAARVATALDGIFVNPQVSVTISTPRNLAIGVLGEVKSPGTVSVPVGTDMLALLSRVGGLTQFASKRGIYVLRKLPKPVRIRFDYNALIGGEQQALAFKLTDGDTVVVE